MKILYTAFNGKNNSSKILLDNINSDNKLYLRNSFKTSVEQLIKKIKNNDFDLIISLGQAPLKKDTIKLEIIGKNKIEYKTKYDYTFLKKKLDKEFETVISSNAGNYLCNNIYFHGLKYISENDLKAKMIFIHIPLINNISNIKKISNILEKKV